MPIRRELAKGDPDTGLLPFNVGDAVFIMRHAHGWNDRGVPGVVVSRTQRPTGTYSYVVVDDNGGKYAVNHTRDLRDRL